MHGCFWHGHSCKRGSRLPKTNAKYWKTKIARNVERHSAQVAELFDNGWTVLTVWECELSDQVALLLRLEKFLDDTEE